MPKDVTARSWPMRWPAGARWFEPAALDLIKDTPIDCLVVPWSAARSAGASLRPFLEEAGRRGLALVALADSSADQAAARAAGFAAVASPEAGAGVIPWMPRAKMPRDSAAPVLAVTESVWPSVKGGQEDRAAVREAGPTGVPWVDSNGWFIQMARAIAPGKGVWTVVDPPAKILTLRGESYALAVADAAVYGGRWVIALDDEFAGALAGGDAAAQGDWKKVAAAVRFFAARPQWSAYRTISRFGVVSDFRGDNEYLSTEALNLIARRHVPYTVLEKSAVRQNSLAGLKTVIYAALEPPEGELRSALTGFAQSGGLLIVPKQSAALASGPGTTESHGRFEVHKSGSGRIAVSTEDEIDPFNLAGDAHILLGRRYDLIRVWNPGAANSHYTAPPDGKSGLLQILSYTRRAADTMSVLINQPWRSARFWTIGAEQPQTVNLARNADGVEANVPPFTVFGAFELEA